MKDQFDPLKTTGFILGRVVRSLHVRVAEALESARISQSVEEVSILTVIDHLDSPRRMGELATLLGRDASTLTHQLNGMTKSGLIRRTPCTEDRRAVVVGITPKGRRLIERSMPVMVSVRGKAMQGISRADEEQLARTLFQMLGNLRDEQ